MPKAATKRPVSFLSRAGAAASGFAANMLAVARRSVKRLLDLGAPTALAGARLLGALAGGFLLIIPNLQAFGMIFVLGWILIAARIVFLWLVPTLCKISGILCGTINLLMEALNIFIQGIILAFFLVQETVYTLKGGIGPRPTHRAYESPKHISDDEMKAFLNRIASTCGVYDGFVPIWNFVVRAVASPTVCPVIRATYPVQPENGINLYTVTNATLGWMSFDSEPYPGGNCEARQGMPDWVCVGLGAGYLVLELFLPVLAGGLFVYTLSGPFMALLYRIAVAIWVVGTIVVQFMFKTLESLS